MARQFLATIVSPDLRTERSIWNFGLEAGVRRSIYE